jgi:pimeloyl-ACP methyl ester carboxylesterase
VAGAPEVHYARSGDAHIAYQVLGDGPLDLVLVSEWWSNRESDWESPQVSRTARRLASFSRLILFDQHGTGLSGSMPPGPFPPLGTWLDDIDVVLDTVGSSRAGLFGFGSGGPLAMLFAARHPERTCSLVLLNTYARLARADDYPHGVPSSFQAASVDWVEKNWGTGAMLDIVSPGVAADQRTRQWWARHERLSANPGAAAEFWRMTFDVDVRPLLDQIRVPTLVLHNEGDRAIRVDHGRYLAEHIPGARYIEFPGGDHGRRVVLCC